MERVTDKSLMVDLVLGPPWVASGDDVLLPLIDVEITISRRVMSS
jgi:hypothetical protein